MARGSARDRRSRRGPGTFGFLMVSGVVITSGFGAGLLAGILFEEPALLLDHILGNTSRVTLEARGSAEPGEALPGRPGGWKAAVRRESPQPGSRRPTRTREKPGASPPAVRLSRPPDVAAAPPRASFSVQVGAFAERVGARRLESELREAGLPVYVAVARDPQGTRWRVRVGPVASRDEADRLAARLKRDRKLPTWVLADSHK